MSRFIYILIVLFLICCSNKENKKIDYPIYVYPNDSSLSNELGHVKDYLTTYYPEQILLNNVTVNTNIDSILAMWCSNYMYAAKEPVLYNYYLNRDVIRFLWVQTRRNSFVFNVIKESNNYYLDIKETSKDLHFANILIMKDAQKELNSGILTQSEYDSLYIINDIQLMHENDIFNVKKRISIKKEEWDSLINLLELTSFWDTLCEERDKESEDGSFWVIEAHLNNRYWYTVACNPEKELYSIGTYIKQLSGIKENESLD